MSKHGDHEDMVNGIATCVKRSEMLRRDADLCPECFFPSLIMSLCATMLANDHMTDDDREEFANDVATLILGDMSILSQETVH